MPRRPPQGPQDGPLDGAGESGPAGLRVDEKQLQAAALRIAGVQYAEIARRLGYADPSGAFVAAQAGLRMAAEQPTEDRELLLALAVRRCDDMLVGLWSEARRGNVLAVDRVLKVEERRDRLLNITAGSAAPATGESDLERARRIHAERRAQT